MRHEMSIVMAVMRHVNETVFQKTLALSDFYFGSDDWEYPLGLIQMCAKSHLARSRARPSGLARMAAGDAVRGDGAALDGFLASVRGSSASE